VFTDDPNEWDDEQSPAAIKVMKNGYECWSRTMAELTFEYVMKHMEDTAFNKSIRDEN